MGRGTAQQASTLLRAECGTVHPLAWHAMTRPSVDFASDGNGWVRTHTCSHARTQERLTVMVSFSPWLSGSRRWNHPTPPLHGLPVLLTLTLTVGGSGHVHGCAPSKRGRRMHGHAARLRPSRCYLRPQLHAATKQNVRSKRKNKEKGIKRGPQS
jgi:hypothetical protein